MWRHDDDHLYAAGWFYDSEPDRITVNSLYRDRWNGVDAFAIYVDAIHGLALKSSSMHVACVSALISVLSEHCL